MASFINISDTNTDDTQDYIELDGNESNDDNELDDELDEEEETNIEKSQKKRSIVHINFDFNKQENLYYCMHCR